MDESESPFARTPAPGVTGPPSGLTWESQVARAGEIAPGLSRQPKGVRFFGRLVILLPLLALTLVVIAMAVAGVAALING